MYKLLARVVMGDIRSTSGKNLHNIALETKMEPLVTSKLVIGEALGRSAVPEENKWKLPLLTRLLEERRAKKADGDEVEDINTWIEVVCTSTFD